MVKVKENIDITEIKMGEMKPGKYYVLDFKNGIVQDICFLPIDEVAAIYREKGKDIFVEVEEVKESE